MMHQQLVAGRYQVQGQLGSGAFATVVAGSDARTGQQVALKLMERASPQDIQAELAAHRAIAQADPRGDRHICKLAESASWGPRSVLVFPRMGPSLETKIAAGHRGTPQQVALLAKQMGEALNALHFDCKLIHTDIKPENILLKGDAQGIGNGWALCDFGSSSFYSSRPDRDLVCTVFYRPPEVLAGQAWSYAVDYWSLGCVLFEARTGEKLFNPRDAAHHWALLESRMGEPPRWLGRRGTGMLGGGPALTSVPAVRGDAEFSELLQGLLQWDPALRTRGDEIGHSAFVSRHCGRSVEPRRGRLPPSPYSSGAICTPGCSGSGMRRSLSTGAVPRSTAPVQQQLPPPTQRPPPPAPVPARRGSAPPSAPARSASPAAVVRSASTSGAPVRHSLAPRAAAPAPRSGGFSGRGGARRMSAPAAFGDESSDSSVGEHSTPAGSRSTTPLPLRPGAGSPVPPPPPQRAAVRSASPVEQRYVLPSAPPIYAAPFVNPRAGAVSAAPAPSYPGFAAQRAQYPGQRGPEPTVPSAASRLYPSPAGECLPAPRAPRGTQHQAFVAGLRDGRAPALTRSLSANPRGGAASRVPLVRV